MVRKIQLEERDLVQQFGDQYRRYRQHAAMLVLFPGLQVRRSE
jgi:protein-S-isoprenylcysteine O-methyltransferase Ste14